tara:strand:- start:12 stop:530 length:519 start_codon:yes stop_codon:yes gene_type:complete
MTNFTLITEQSQSTAARLARVLADTYVLYTKTQGFHWNVTGPHFRALHGMFEEQYTDLAAAVDMIAERIRGLGAFAPGSLIQLQRLATLSEEQSVPGHVEMIQQLYEGHQVVQTTIREVLSTVASTGDASTEDMLVERLRVHEKTAWMLRAHLEQPIAALATVHESDLALTS